MTVNADDEVFRYSILTAKDDEMRWCWLRSGWLGMALSERGHTVPGSLGNKCLQFLNTLGHRGRNTSRRQRPIRSFVCNLGPKVRERPPAPTAHSE